VDVKTTIMPNSSQGKEVKVACAKCIEPTKHNIMFSVDILHNYRDEISESESHQIVRCLGCDSLSLRLVRSNSEDIIETGYGEFEVDEKEELYPPRAVGRPLLNDAHFLPYQVEYVYKETHHALCSNLRVLAAIGIRVLVEAVCKEEEAEGDNLYQRINNLVKLGVLTEPGARILQGIRDVGNDAAHETKRHRPEKLGTAFDVAENLLQNVYIIPEKAHRLGFGQSESD